MCGSAGSSRTRRSLGPLEIGQHEDAEELGASGRHGAEARLWRRSSWSGLIGLRLRRGTVTLFLACQPDGNEIGRHDAGGARVGRWRPWILSRMRSAER